jgi:hypothetical protein
MRHPFLALAAARDLRVRFRQLLDGLYGVKKMLAISMI